MIKLKKSLYQFEKWQALQPLETDQVQPNFLSANCSWTSEIWHEIDLSCILKDRDIPNTQGKENAGSNGQSA